MIARIVRVTVWLPMALIATVIAVPILVVATVVDKLCG